MREWPPLEIEKAHLFGEGFWLWLEAAQTTEAGFGALALALSPREEAFLQTLSHPRRRLEWKQSRLMAKSLLAMALGCPSVVSPMAFEVLPQPYGPPLVLCEGKPLSRGTLSLSHSGLYVGVAFAPFSLGLDICDKADATRIARIAHRAFATPEAALCEAPQHLAALWDLKEATLKMQGGGIFRPGLSSVRVLSLFPPALAAPKAHTRLYALKQAYVALAFAA